MIAIALFILALVGGSFALRLRSRLDALARDVNQQRREIDELSAQLRQRRAQDVQAPQPARPVVEPPPGIPVSPPPAPRPVERPAAPSVPPRVVPNPVPPPPVPWPPADPPPQATPRPPAWRMPRVAIDWEDLVGVKLFSAVAGIALLLSAIFFLRYSLDHGWLQPSIRVAIGVIVATSLLVLCELKAARKYRVTANALDASAIAILFSTFYAAYALWSLIPNLVAFGLLILVTALAVLLSIRHDSRFIAVLGLLGGFATPALLSTGANQPVPLFTYLLLLNAGLAWVAHRKGWSLLSILTLILTAIYQWGWVIRFLTVSQLSLAMGIFVVFSVMSLVTLTLARKTLEHGASSTDKAAGTALEGTGLAASVMPLMFAIYLSAVPGFGAQATLLFGFLFVLDVGLLAVAIARREELLHAIGGLATLLVFAIWLAQSYSSSAWVTATGVAALCVVLYALAPLVAARVRRPFDGLAGRAIYTAPLLLFVFPVIARIEPAAASPSLLFATLFVLLALLAWRALTIPDASLFFIAAFFAVVAEASWSVTHLQTQRLGAAILLYGAFAVFFLGVPIVALRMRRPLIPRSGVGAVVLASVVLLVILAEGPTSATALWGLALLVAILNAGLFVESAAGRMTPVSAIASLLSWLVLMGWWVRNAAAVGLLPSLMLVVALTLVMLGGYAWVHSELQKHGDDPDHARGGGFAVPSVFGLAAHVYLFFIFLNPEWSMPPWPALGALLVVTLALSATSLFVRTGWMHAASVTAAAIVVQGWAFASLGGAWSSVALITAEAVIAYAFAWLWIGRRVDGPASSIGAMCTLFIGELALIAVSFVDTPPPLAALALAHVVNVTGVLWLAWVRQWPWISSAAVLPAWLATVAWQIHRPEPAAWLEGLGLATSLYAVFALYPFVLGRRTRATRDPYLTAIAGSVFFLFTARNAFLQGGMSSLVGIVPVVEGIVMALLLRSLLRLEPAGERDLGRLAVVAAAALGFATVAIPLQLRQQWITIGWALEGAALAWLYRRIPHRGLLYAAAALMSAVFVRLALNPQVFLYEPRGMRVLNWYLYGYLTCAVAMFVAAWWFSRTDDSVPARATWSLRLSSLLPPAGVILLFLLLNIEIADFYATGPEIAFKFGVTIAQDFTYTVGWLVFGLGLLAACIYLHNRPGRMAAVALIAVTMGKAFLYDMGSLGGLYRVASFAGLAVSLALVALALQKFVLQAPKERS